MERYAARGCQAFESDELIQTWIVHHIQIIGEAARTLSQHLRARHSEAPWIQIATMRNILVHDYFRIDLNEIWLTVERDLPDLKRDVESILKELEEPPMP